MKRRHDARHLDVARFASEGAALAGAWPGAELGRLAECQTPPQDSALAEVQWQVRGQTVPAAGADDEIWLALSARSTLWLACQRCLQPMAQTLAIDRRLRFVQGEAEAEALDAELEDDVLALTRSINLAVLVEDELLLALPLVPRHETCPEPLAVAVDGPARAADEPPAEAAKHPFAVLKQWRRNGDPS